MKEIRKKLIIMLIIMILSITGTVAVQADTSHSFNATVAPASKNIKPGEEITIALSLSEINMGTDGINTLEGTIEYDKEIFEEVTSSSIKSQNNWVTTYNDENSTMNGKFLSFNLVAGVTESTEIFTVTLKAKNNIETTTTTQIDFKDITSNNGTDLINAGTKTVNVTIEVENEDDENTVNNTIENNVNNTQPPTTTTNTTNTSVTNKVNNTQSSEKLPDTGKPILIIIAIMLVGIIAVYLGKRNSYYKGI